MARTPLLEGESWFYGAPGWTHECGVEDLLEPFLIPGTARHRDFARFAGLDAAGAAALLGALPETNLRDRQNRGPECGAALRAAVRHPGQVTLHGYLVSAPRWDERVSVDGMVARGVILPAAGDGSVSLRQIFRELCDHLRLGPRTGFPDEFRQLSAEDPGASAGWWMWWD